MPVIEKLHILLNQSGLNVNDEQKVPLFENNDKINASCRIDLKIRTIFNYLGLFAFNHKG